MIKLLIFKTNSVDETEKLGYNLAKKINSNKIIALFGDMGAGKTAFVRGFARYLGVENEVSSPTFAIVHEYNGDFNVYHFDMYRVNTIDDLYSTGFFEYIDKGILIIEWSENIENIIPDYAIKIRISKNFKNENIREIFIEGIEEI